jgi:hypothetical protein
MDPKKVLAGFGGVLGLTLLAIVVVVGLYLGGVIKDPSSGGKGGGREGYGGGGAGGGGCQSCPYQQN